MTENDILNKYSKIFRQKDLSMQETCMVWGLDCSKHWYPLIDSLCFSLQMYTDYNGYPQVEATQVKEKFGELSFYYTFTDTGIEYDKEKYAFMDGVITMATHLSEHICEHCGTTHEVTQTKGWVRTLCKKCMEEGGFHAIEEKD